MKKNKLIESTGSSNAGIFNGPIVLAPQIWKDDQVGPFTEPVYSYTNAQLAYQEADGDFTESPAMRKKIENRTKKISRINMEKKKNYRGQNDEEGSAINPTKSGLPLKEKLVNEDLAVWFGTKKKPKGSKQPKGPWVNICRKKEGGGHPPCGRPEASSKGYPKCRAAGVASKMSDSEKRSACQQKRKAEKKDPKIGKGNKPTMTSYKPKNEGLRSVIKRLLKEEYDSQRLYPVNEIYTIFSKAPVDLKRIVKKLEPIDCVNKEGVRSSCFRIPEVLHVYMTGRY